MTTTRTWIDTDPAIGIPGCDVDDGLALIQAFHSPELELGGVSAVFGNAPLDKAFPLAQEISRRFGPEGASDARLVRYLANQVRRTVQQLIDRHR